jgi:hypothetical protein
MIQHFEVTPAIGREFKGDIQLDQIMNAPNKDELIKDLAYMGESMLLATIENAC